MYSLPAAWAEHDRLVGAESDDESVPSLEVDSESEPEDGSGSSALVETAPVVPTTPEYFEVTLGGCGTQGCTFKHGHDGLCSSVALVPRRRRFEQHHLDGLAARSSPSRLGESL